MGFLIVFLGFFIILILSFIATIYIYIRFAFAVKSDTEVPAWIYKIGQSFKSRSYITFDNITDSTAFKEATLFIVRLIFINLLFMAVAYHNTHSLTFAAYKCIKAQFALVLVTTFIQKIIKLISITRAKLDNPVYSYASTNAVIASIFFTSFILMLCTSMAGVPVKPLNVQLDNTNVIIGETTAADLISSGFTFKDASPNDIVVNQRNDHFYYGKLVEITKDGKSYGNMFLTPERGDKDKLRNCIVTFYRVEATNKQISKVKINNTRLENLRYNDFNSKKMINIFSLNPLDYKEDTYDNSFSLKVGTDEYLIWKAYWITADFNDDKSPYRYSVGVHHIKWE